MPKSIGHEDTFATDRDDLDGLIDHVEQSATRVASRLRTRNMQGRTVVLKVREHDGAVRFEVLDDGAGLPTEPDGTIDLERLAGQLSRSDSAGLGLVVARRVAEAHGGYIGAENRMEGGASVWLDIPYVY